MHRLYNPKSQRVPKPKCGDLVEIHYSHDMNMVDFIVFAVAQTTWLEIGTGNVRGVTASIQRIIDQKTRQAVNAITRTNLRVGVTENFDSFGIQSVNSVKEGVVELMTEYGVKAAIAFLILVALYGGIVGDGSSSREGQCASTRSGEVCAD